MSDAVTIEWPKEDVEALFRAMERAQRELGYSTGRAIGAGARAVLRSLAASTKIAPKQRTIKRSEDFEAPKKGIYTFDVTGWFGRPPRKFRTKTVRVRSMENAVKYYAAIGKRGLAKAVWTRAWDAIGFSADAGLSAASREVAKLASKLVTGVRVLTGNNPYVKVTNRLSYAQFALQGGPKDVDTAIARAAAGLVHSIEKQLARMAA